MAEKESRRSVRRPQARQTLGTFGKWLFLLLISGAELAERQCCQQMDHKEKRRQVMRMQQEVRIKESKWTEASPRKVEAAER